MASLNGNKPIEKKPKWKSEAKHTQNLVNFGTLLCFCSSYGTSYKPSKEGLMLRDLNTLLIMAKTAQNEVDNALVSYYLAKEERDAAFKPVPGIVGRVYMILEKLTEEPLVGEVALSLVNKIKEGISPWPLQDDKPDGDDQEGPPDDILSLQMDFDFRLDNLQKFICLLNSITGYTPHEPELTCSGLTAFYNILKNKNKNVIETAIILDNARVTRDQVFYCGTTGLVDVATEIKSYIKSVFSSTSSQYLQVENLEFRDLNSYKTEG
jgi:hypothetical protein